MWVAYYRGKIFQKFKEKERFVSDMVLKLNVSKSTRMFKIALSNLIDAYPKIKESWLSLHYLKKNLEWLNKFVKKMLVNLNR